MNDTIQEVEPRPTCQECIFFEAGEIDPNNIGQRQYFCRRNPPTPCVLQTPTAVQITSVYPMTSLASWCGEWDDGQGDDDGQDDGQDES